jgi:hypothetical protein
MKKEELKQLIEKYYDGQTTLGEEKILRDWFAENEAPEGYETEKEIFSYYHETEEIPEPSADLDSRILAAVHGDQGKRGSSRLGRILLPAMSAAAGILIMLSLWLFIERKNSVEKDTYSDPQIAYAETMKILKDVSVRMNRGTAAMTPVGKINEVKTKSLESISKSSRTVTRNLHTLSFLRNSDEINRSSKD